jgi:AraC-like DNA-binding protein
VPQASDTLYTEKAAMDVYGTQPERALVIIDSAEIVGNLTEDRASLLRAKVFCLTCGEARLDTARQICEALLQSNFVKDAPDNREPVLDLLVTASRKKHDNEQWLRWATEKANFCRQQGNKTEALRTEAEIGVILTHLGRQDEGMKKLDDVIRRLDGTRKFNETDACIIALRRKTDVLAEQGLYADIIPLAEKIVEKMNDYEQHPDEFHDGTYREPDAADVPDYCDFYRTKGYAYLASAYANEGDGRKALGYLRLFEQSRWGQTIDGRKMIAPTWCKLGEYDKMLAVYDELVRHMGTDTICFDYAAILHDRAIAAESRGHHAQAYDYLSRYATLSQSLNDSLQASEAHEYAARYHAQEQQMEIQECKAEASRNALVAWFVAVIALLLACFAIYYFLRHREEMLKNRILARQITETMDYKEKYLESEKLRMKSEKFATVTEQPDTPLESLSSEALFTHISHTIVREMLFLDPTFDRQSTIDHFHLSKERIGAAFSQGSDYASISDFINECRLEYAVNLLRDQPSLPITQVAQTSGFSDANYFGRKFKARFGLSPTQFRKQ